MPARGRRPIQAGTRATQTGARARSGPRSQNAPIRSLASPPVDDTAAHTPHVRICTGTRHAAVGAAGASGDRMVVAPTASAGPHAGATGRPVHRSRGPSGHRADASAGRSTHHSLSMCGFASGQVRKKLVARETPFVEVYTRSTWPHPHPPHRPIVGSCRAGRPLHQGVWRGGVADSPHFPPHRRPTVGPSRPPRRRPFAPS